MTYCIKCHRPLKHPTPTGMGPVCAKRAAQPPEHERDLFGYDVEKAVAAALHRLVAFVESCALEARIGLRHEFVKARKRLGVWR